jgi:hypothetical protein
MNFMEKINENHKLDLSAFIKKGHRTAEEMKRAQAILLLAHKAILTLTGLKLKLL